MILGIAHGLNLLFGLELFRCVVLTAIDIFLFPFLITLLDKCKTEMFFIIITCFGIFLYVLGVLISQPEIPVTMNGVFPSSRGETAYSIMSLLGANIMPYNFYLHSSIVQHQWKLPSVSLAALCHDHFFAILFTFSGIFLANNVVMLSAAIVFHNAGLVVLTFQDSLLLIDQIIQSPISPFVLFLNLFLSSQVTAITWTVGGKVFLHEFFGIDVPVWIHRVTVKALAIIPALYCAWNSGDEGIYQLLIYCQVISAMLLPSSVIPLFRVASSQLIMGAFKISGIVEILTMFSFITILCLNLIFILEMLFGFGDWTGYLMWNTGSRITGSYVLVLLMGFTSLGLMLWLVVTPLKSASENPDIQTWISYLQKAIPQPSQDRDESELNETKSDGDGEPVSEVALEKSTVSCSDGSRVSSLDLPETIMDFDNESESYQYADGDSYSTFYTSPMSPLEESTSAVKLAPVVTPDEVFGGRLSDASTVERVESKQSIEKTGGIGWELEEAPFGTFGKIPISTFDGPGSFKSISEKGDGGGNGNGSGSFLRLTGLGRSARRQLASILDEFWGQLFNFHGQVTKEARANRIDVMLGLDWKPSERCYSSLRLPTYSDVQEYQPATIHGSETASYLSRIAADRNTNYSRIPLDPSTPKHTYLVLNYEDPFTYSLGQNRLGSLSTSSMQNPEVPVISRLRFERNYYDSSSVGTNENVGFSINPKSYHSLPGISGVAVSKRNFSLADGNAQWSSLIAPGPPSLHMNSTSRSEGVPLAFDELSPSKRYGDAFSLPLSSNIDTKSLWIRQPFEQLFGSEEKPRSGADEVPGETMSYMDAESKLLQSFRYCIMKLLKLEGGNWLFEQNGGFDEGLIVLVAARESFLYEAETREVTRVQMSESSLPKCGEGCILQAALIVSFGVWCIRLILHRLLMESRPELWGKYTYVLNRLQGIINLAFFKSRPRLSPCSCLQAPGPPWKKSGPLLSNGLSLAVRNTSATMILDIIKDVEAAVSCRGGRPGTGAGDIAFPKGKENVASVLNRYKRRLSNQPVGPHDGLPRSRNVPLRTSSFSAYH
ncbi:ethylene-insensitive protein 2.2-like isoform X2 [Tasmannia lanceolata]